MDQKLHGSPTLGVTEGHPAEGADASDPRVGPAAKASRVQGQLGILHKRHSPETLMPPLARSAEPQTSLYLHWGLPPAVWSWARILHVRVLVFCIQNFYSNICL